MQRSGCLRGLLMCGYKHACRPSPSPAATASARATRSSTAKAYLTCCCGSYLRVKKSSTSLHQSFLDPFSILDGRVPIFEEAGTCGNVICSTVTLSCSPLTHMQTCGRECNVATRTRPARCAHARHQHAALLLGQSVQSYMCSVCKGGINGGRGSRAGGHGRG